MNDKNEIKDNKEIIDTLILSGEAINGFMTLGSLQFLLDYEVFNVKNIRKYIATSSGSMISYLLSIGYTPVELYVFLCSNDVFRNLKDFDFMSLIKGTGCIKFTAIEQLLEILTLKKLDHIPTLKDIYDKFNVTLIFTTYNMSLQKREFLSYVNYPNMSCIKAIHMSSSIPFVFDNCSYNDNIYVDGLFTNNFPLCQLKPNDKYIGICLLNNRNDVKKITYSSFIHKINHLISSIVTSNTLTQIENNTKNNAKKNENHKIRRIYTLRKCNLLSLNFSIDNTSKTKLFCSGYDQSHDIFYDTSK